MTLHNRGSDEGKIKHGSCKEDLTKKWAYDGYHKGEAFATLKDCSIRGWTREMCCLRVHIRYSVSSAKQPLFLGLITNVFTATGIAILPRVTSLDEMRGGWGFSPHNERTRR